MVSLTVNLKLDGLAKFKQAVDFGAGPIRDAIRQWAYRYRTWAQRRFDSYSKGGGDWPALALTTIRGRRKGKNWGKNKKRSSLARDTLNEFGRGAGALVSAGGTVSILRDTGLLFMALAPAFIGTPGAIQEDLPFGVKVGYGGSQTHGQSKTTIAGIAAFHQTGGGKLPKREIIVAPDAVIVERMAKDMERALNKYGKDIIG